ncbi:MAG: PAC2 family protein [Candidatus Thermoplasmatota archaeon]|nr:PAC2 family protein [Candidatus Thermoplasmatota archaeon]
MNRTKIHWLEKDGAPKKSMILEAVPGVGNVGKIVVDGLIDKHPSRVIGWILHPDFPPHATLSKEGLIGPPRLDIVSVILPNGECVCIVTGVMQPMTAPGQFEVAEAILGLARDSEASRVLVLAGLAAEPDSRSIYAVCSDRGFRKNLESEDIIVSRSQPKGGMIGVAGMVLSLSTTLGVPALGVIAETVGASSDVLAADRMAGWIEQAFEVPLDLDLDTTKETAAKLMEKIGSDGPIEDYLAMDETEASSDFYV